VRSINDGKINWGCRAVTELVRLAETG